MAIKRDATKPTQDFYFTYPADGTKKTISKGRVIIDFYAGTVKLPDGTEERLSDSLRRFKQDGVAIGSLSIYSSQAAKYALDEGGLKPIDASDFQTERNQSFTKLRLETTTDTQITIWASTNPDAFFGKLGATTTGGIINSYGVQIDPLAEYGTPKIDLGYYSGSDTGYQTLVSLIIAAGKYGVLYEIGLTPDTAARFKLAIGGVEQFADKKILNPVGLPFAPNKLATGSVILLEVKSADGTAIEVNGYVSIKEVST